MFARRSWPRLAAILFVLLTCGCNHSTGSGAFAAQVEDFLRGLARQAAAAQLF